MKWLIFQRKIKKNWELLVVILIAIIFFVSTSFFVWKMNNDGLVKWLSPDENANYFFTQLFYKTGSLVTYDSLNINVQDIVHPRSFRSDLGELKPVSFLGIILIYGFFAKIYGTQIIPYLTPIIGAIGVIFYYLFIKKIFTKKIAFISSLFLAFFPVYVYYSARSMFHNILFSVLFIIGSYFLSQFYEKKYEFLEKNSILKSFLSYRFHDINQLAICALAGVFFGLALFVRTSELIWIGPLLICIWFMNFRTIRLTHLVVFILFLLLGYSPAFYFNQILYGSIWLGGYHEMNNSIVDMVSASEKIAGANFFSREKLTNALEVLKKNIFYFGFKSFESWQQFINYFMIMFFWIFWPAVFGFSRLVETWKEQPNKIKKYIVSYFILLPILMFYYGSWKFNDNPDLSSVTIGNSYTRYWLPIYMGAFPFVAIFYIKISETFAKRKAEFSSNLFNIKIQNNSNGFIDSLHIISANNERFKKTKKFFRENIFSLFMRKELIVNAIISFLVLISLFVSVQYLLFGSEEGLIETYHKHKIAKQDMLKIFKITPKNSVIITRYHDKLLFPERRVIVGLFDDNNMIRNYAKIAHTTPLYYYNFTLPQKDVEYLNNRRLVEFNLSLKEIATINDFSLYKVEVIKK